MKASNKAQLFILVGACVVFSALAALSSSSLLFRDSVRPREVLADTRIAEAIDDADYVYVGGRQHIWGGGNPGKEICVDLSWGGPGLQCAPTFSEAVLKWQKERDKLRGWSTFSVTTTLDCASVPHIEPDGQVREGCR